LPSELTLSITTSSSLTSCLFDISRFVQRDSLLTLILTLFLCFIFVAGSFVFTMDAERLFFQPIERMLKNIRGLAKILLSVSDKQSADKLDETILIEAVITKIADIFRVRLDS
jgi:hypothetical protein